MEVLQERKKYNDMIEQTDLACTLDVRDIHTFRQTERGASILALYERLYADFDLLYILTANLEKVKESEVVKSAEKWLTGNRNIRTRQDNKVIQEIAETGATVFIEYHNLLMDKNVITLPGR